MPKATPTGRQSGVRLHNPLAEVHHSSPMLGAHRPKRLTKSPTEKDPIMPPTEKMATERDQSVVRVAGLMGSSYRYSQVRL